MKRRGPRAQVELGYAGLALLRSWPFEDRTDLIREIAHALASDEWKDQLVAVDEHDVRGGYSRWAETYDSRPNPLIYLEEPALRGVIDNLPPGRTLDAACGTGRLTAALLERGHDVLAIDASAAMLKQCRTRVPSAQLCLGDLAHLPLADGVMDVAVCALALTHIEGLRTPVAELARVVRRGGRVVLSDIHPVAVATGAHAFFHDIEGSRGVVRNHVHWHGDYIAAFRSVGLKIRSCLEPRVDQGVLELLAPSLSVRSWIRDALFGLPMALIWDLEHA